MIYTIITHACPRCGSEKLVKNGHDYKSAQKYHCKSCGRYGTLQAQRGCRDALRAQVTRAVLERVSLRGIERLFGLSRRTVSRWLPGWIAHLPRLSASLLPAQADDVLELDELWSFVGSKKHQRWVWLALCRRTRQVVACWVGDRSEISALQLWRQLPDEYVHCASFSDYWEAYRSVFDLRRHHMVGKAEGETAHVERWFNTLRQRLARFTRKRWRFPSVMRCIPVCCTCFSMPTTYPASVKMSPLPLQVMYLDKPLKEHNLLQATCRTNRVYPRTANRAGKSHGLIVDYIGVFDEVARSMTIVDQEIMRVVTKLDGLREEFAPAIEKCLGYFQGVSRAPSYF